jgi:predicted PurR-regulated permease PerM
MNQVLRYFLLIIAVAAIGFIVWYFKDIVAYILVSAVLSLIGRPLIDLLDRIHIRKLHIPRAFSALVTLVILWAFFLTFFRVFLPLIARQANQLSNLDMQAVNNALAGPVSKADDLFHRLKIIPDQNVSLMDYLTHQLMNLLNVSLVSNIFGSLASLLGNIAIAVFSITFLTFFFLKDERLFVDYVMLLVPGKYEIQFRHGLSSVKRLLMRYFIGILLQITAIITLVTTGLTIVGVGFDNAIVIGLLAGILDVIPYVGPWMAAFFGIILGIATHIEYNFATQLLPMIGYMALVFVIVRVMDDTLFQPLIYGTSVMAHPIEIFLVILIAGSLAGIPGMILAVPVYTVIRVFAKEFFSQYKLVKKITEKI